VKSLSEEPDPTARGDRDATKGPTDEEVEAWVERERQRRHAWLEGPTEEEKRAWAARRRRLGVDVAEDRSCERPTDEEIELWVERERERRRAWLEGPTEEERRAWARRSSYRRTPGALPRDDYAKRAARRARRDSRLAAQGLGTVIMDWPFWAWSRLISLGREWEEEEELRLSAPNRRIPMDFDL
jgi:hypothetical protein